jgi:uridine kinase
LDDCWDFRVFVDVDFAETLRRACERGVERFGLGLADAVRHRYQVRYIPGQQIYLETVRPRERADVVIENGDLSEPRLLVRSPSGDLGSSSQPG